jgi:putative heme-binding domain-containing protein
MLEADPLTAEHITNQLARHRVSITGLPDLEEIARATAEPQTPIAIPAVDPNDPNLIANMAYEEAVQRALNAQGDAERGKTLFTRQSCIACHTYASGQNPKGPHLVDIGKRYKPAELLESLLKPSAKIAQGFDTYSFVTDKGRLITGFVVLESADAVQIRLQTGMLQEFRQEEIDERIRQTQSIMPVGLANNLTPQQLADLLAYLQSLH